MRVNSSTWRKSAAQFVGNECTAERPNGCLQQFVNQRISILARIFRLPRILTLDAHFVKPSAKAVQDILLQNGNKDGWRFHECYSQLSTEEAYRKWCQGHASLTDLGDAVFAEAVENNQTLVDMIEPIEMPKTYHLPEVEFPLEISSDPSLPDFDSRLRRKIMRRILKHGRLPQDERRTEYLARLKMELEVIEGNPTLNFLPYFDIIDEHVCEYARSAGELTGPGRGSAAGCLLAYLLKITHIDPIRWNLSFARFLSLGRIARGKFPDIDLDFGNPKVVVDYLATRYGDKFARICTTGTMRPKNAIKDVSRIMLDTRNDKAMADHVNKVCLTIDNVPQGMDTKKWLYGYENDEGYHAGHIETNETLKTFFDAYPGIKEMVDRVLDVPRSIGRHASAYCISDVPLTNLVPMCEIKEEICTQFTMGPVESLGLVKMDLLGINTLKDISGCIKKIQERHGIEIDIYKIEDEKPGPENTQPGIWIHCPKTFAAFCDGRNETVFQFKSSISTGLCKSVKPKSIIDLANITANGRPGTMYALMEDGKTTLIDAWVQRRKGEMPVSYPHPELEGILEETQGTWTFQEQIMAAFVQCCGYSEEESDEIREVIGKKKKDKMEKILPEIRRRLLERGWTESQTESFVSACVAASSYSFNKCLDPNTEVQTMSGKKPMSDIKKGDKILAWNTGNKEEHYVSVVDVIASDAELWEIETEDGKKSRSSLEHKYLCEDGEMHPLSEILRKDLRVLTQQDMIFGMSIIKTHPKDSERSYIPRQHFDVCLVDGATKEMIAQAYPGPRCGVYYIEQFQEYLKRFDFSLKDYCQKYLEIVWPTCPVTGEEVGHRPSGLGLLLSRFKARVGIKKEFSANTRAHAEKMSLARRGAGNPMFGKEAWNKGMDAASDPRMATLATKGVGRIQSEEARQKHRDNRAAHPKKARHTTAHTKESLQKMREATARRHSLGLYLKKSSIHQKMEDIIADLGIKFQSEYLLDFYSIDIAIPEKKVAIEVDGDYFHANPLKYPDGPQDATQQRSFKNDRAKEGYLRNRGWTLLRYWESSIKSSEIINQVICDFKKLKLLDESGNPRP